MSMQSEAFPIEICDDAAMADALSVLGSETFIQAFGHLYAREDLNAFLEESHSSDCYRQLIADPQSRVWTVKDADDALIAYSVARPCTLPVEDMPARSGELARLYALKQYQGAGLGRRLLEVTLNWLQERFEHVYLSVYAENFGAMRLYERYGFEKTGAYSFMVGAHADPEFIMKQVK